MLKVIESKVTKDGFVVSIVCNENGLNEYFAMGKKYWIVFQGSGRYARNCSNSLAYLKKVLAKIN